jgi:transposase-like protein
MDCANCSEVDATKQAHFEGFSEPWCDSCYQRYYLGEVLNPHRAVCELCPEGNHIHTVVSNWRDKVFKVCNNCRADLVVETETRQKKIQDELDKSSDV